MKAMGTHSDIMCGSSVSGHMSPFLSVIYNISCGVIPAWQKDSIKTWCYYKLLFTFTMVSEGYSLLYSLRLPEELIYLCRACPALWKAEALIIKNLAKNCSGERYIPLEYNF